MTNTEQKFLNALNDIYEAMRRIVAYTEGLSLDDLPFENFLTAWTTFDLASISRSKRLWDY